MTKWTKTTLKDFDTYQKLCLEWQKRLGLTNWALYFQRDDDRSSYGRTRWDIDGAVATITLSKEWDDFRSINDSELNRLALHEMLHVLLAEIVHVAESRYTNDGELSVVEHHVLRRIENVILENSNAKV